MQFGFVIKIKITKIMKNFEYSSDLIERIDRDGSYSVSRDYALIILCEQTECPINKLNFCSMPSCIEISSGGNLRRAKNISSWIEWPKKSKRKRKKMIKNGIIHTKEIDLCLL